MTNPKITIVIPTRERCGVLKYALRTATGQDYDNLEIIVSDNCSSDDTENVARQAHDNRIRYLNTGKRMSMSHNWEFALSHVADGWVTFMGDDDGLMPQSVHTVAEIINATKAKAIRSRFCTYDWPGVAERPRGQLIVPLTSGLATRRSDDWLVKVLCGKAKYNQLPMIYNGGFIHVSVLKQIKQKLGAFFMSSNPDVFTAVAIAKIVGTYIFTNEPLAINGTSKYSNGHSAFSTSGQRDIRPYMQFMNEGNIPLHKDIPASGDGGIPLSLQVCTYEAHLQSGQLGAAAVRITHAQQLAVILATAGKHRVSVVEWGERFARLHGIDFQAAVREARFKRGYLQSVAMAKKCTPRSMP